MRKQDFLSKRLQRNIIINVSFFIFVLLFRPSAILSITATMSNFINTTPSTMPKKYPAPPQSTTAKERPSKVVKFRIAQKLKVEERCWPLPRKPLRIYPLIVRPSTPVSLAPVIGTAAESDPEHLALEDDAEKNVAEFQKALNLIPKIWLWRVMQTKTWQNS